MLPKSMLNYNYQRLQIDEVQEAVCQLMAGVMKTEEVRPRWLFGIYSLIAMDRGVRQAYRRTVTLENRE